MTHRDTWELWLKEISILRMYPYSLPDERNKDDCNDIVDSMAEALSLAAPQGPIGFHCIEQECQLHQINGVADMNRLIDRIADLESALKSVLNARSKSDWIESEEIAVRRTAAAILEDGK